MLLKKQTVWLLTMLSLVVVLSVYYITAPEKESNVAGVNSEKSSDKSGESTVITQVSGDEVFEALRQEMEDQRSAKLEELQEIVAKTDLPASERSAAKDEMENINEIAAKEKLIESLIVSTMGYKDALVRADGEQVMITVKAEEASPKAANDIIRLVNKEIGETFVAVEFDTGK